jgi:fimbrial chaperone protein
MHEHGKTTRRVALLALLLAFSARSGAASLQVAPTSVVLHAGQKAEAVWLSNTDAAEPVRAQVRLFKWTQPDGTEHLDPTQAMVVSPPMIELAPGARQLVRVVLAGSPSGGAEDSYRIIVDEVPGQHDGGQQGLQFLLRYSIPVFVLPADGQPVAPALQSRLELHDGKATLVVSNGGRAHAQLADLTWVDASGTRHPMLAGLVGYVLPGSTMRWDLPAPADQFGAGGSFKARINGEAVEQTLALGHPQR